MYKRYKSKITVNVFNISFIYLKVLFVIYRISYYFNMENIRQDQHASMF